MSTIAISDIRFDGGTQSRACISEQVVSDYAEAMQAGAIFPPVVAFFDGAEYWLADGFHRYQAYARAKIKAVPADVRQGTQRDAILFSVGANAIHGLRRTNDDKRRAVLTLLNDKEWSKWSQKKIAEACGVSQPFVSRIVSAEKPASYAENKIRTVERNGATYEQNTTNIGRSPKELNGHAPSAKPVATAQHEPLPSPESAAPVDPERRKLAKLTPDALIDEVLGLRADLADEKAKTAKQAAEIRELKQQVKDLSATDSGAVIRRLQQDVNNANNKRWKESEKTKHALKTAYAAKKELKALGREEIPL